MLPVRSLTNPGERRAGRRPPFLHIDGQLEYAVWAMSRTVRVGESTHLAFTLRHPGHDPGQRRRGILDARPGVRHSVEPDSGPLRGRRPHCGLPESLIHDSDRGAGPRALPQEETGRLGRCGGTRVEHSRRSLPERFHCPPLPADSADVRAGGAGVRSWHFDAPQAWPVQGAGQAHAVGLAPGVFGRLMPDVLGSLRN